MAKNKSLVVVISVLLIVILVGSLFLGTASVVNPNTTIVDTGLTCEEKVDCQIPELEEVKDEIYCDDTCKFTEDYVPPISEEFQ